MFFLFFLSLSLSHFGHLRMQSHFPLFLHLFQVSFILKVHRVWICLRYLCVGVASLARGKDTDFQSFIFSSFWEPCLLFFSECNSLSTSVKPTEPPWHPAHAHTHHPTSTMNTGRNSATSRYIYFSLLTPMLCGGEPILHGAHTAWNSSPFLIWKAKRIWMVSCTFFEIVVPILKTSRIRIGSFKIK